MVPSMNFGRFEYSTESVNFSDASAKQQIETMRNEDIDHISMGVNSFDLLVVNKRMNSVAPIAPKKAAIETRLPEDFIHPGSWLGLVLKIICFATFYFFPELG